MGAAFGGNASYVPVLLYIVILCNRFNVVPWSLLRLVPIIAILGLAVILLPNLKFDNSIEKWIPRKGKEVARYEAFLDEFKSDAFLLISFETPDTISPNSVRKLRDRFEKGLDSLSYINRISRWPSPFIQFEFPATACSHTTFAISYSPVSHLKPDRPELVDILLRLSEDIVYPSHIGGPGVVAYAANIEVNNDIRKFLLGGFLIILIALWLITRNILFILVSVGVAAGGIAIVVLAAVLFDIAIGITATVIPVVVMFYSITLMMHIYFHGGNYRQILLPSLLAGLTTCLAFVVFLFDEIPLLNEFGILIISGILGGFLFSLMLAYPSVNIVGKKPVQTIRFPVPAKRTSLAAAFLLIIISIPGILKINLDVNDLSVLSEDNRIISDHQFLQNCVSNYLTVEYTFDIKDTPKQLLKSWATAVEKHELIRGHISYYDFSGGPFGINPRNYGYVSRDRKTGRISFLMKRITASQGAELSKTLTQLASEHFDNPPVINGYAPLFASIFNQLTRSFVQNVLLAFLLIFFVIAFYLREPGLILKSILPNLLPIIAILGMIGWLEIPLDMATLPIACIMLGIIVDDTIHYLYWYRKSRSVKRTLASVAPGIFYSSLVIIAGFSLLLAAKSPPVRHLGVFCISGFLFAALADLILLSSLLKDSRKQ